MDQYNLTKPYLSLRQIDSLLASIKGRHEARDRCLLLLMFRHGLHVSEACGLQLQDLDLDKGRMLIRRNHSHPDTLTSHSLRDDEVKNLRIWLEVRTRMRAKTNDVFISANRTRLSRKTVWLLMKHHGDRAGLPVSIYPEILRESSRALQSDRPAPFELIRSYLGSNKDVMESESAALA